MDSHFTEAEAALSFLGDLLTERLSIQKLTELSVLRLENFITILYIHPKYRRGFITLHQHYCTLIFPFYFYFYIKTHEHRFGFKIYKRALCSTDWLFT